MLIIEVDGSSHEWEGAAERDAIRQKKLEVTGFTVLRFANTEVLNNISSVREYLVDWVEKNK